MDKNSIKKIDFVITWVDGNDPQWRKDFCKVSPDGQTDSRPQRYRDFGLLKYWFRGVETFVPWVNKIYFITYGHLPKWLNLNNPKLVVIRHDEYIPNEYLPTFNSNVIELHIHKIPDLSEYFVLFNDDMYLINHMSPTDFFYNNLPRDTAALTIHSVDMNVRFSFASLNAISFINKYFIFHQTIRNNWMKWLNPANGKCILRTLYLLPCIKFPGILQTHLPVSYLKSSFEKVWEMEPTLFVETSTHKLRTKFDFSHWTIRCWQIASGLFTPRSNKIGKNYNLEEDNLDDIIKCIHSKCKMICINDGELSDEKFIVYRNQLREAFDTLLPNKSSFEE